MNKPNIIAVANQKGGVGKTTTAVNIAAALVKRGKKVLCVDLDPQGNLSEYLGFTGGGKTVGDLLLTAIHGETIEPIEYIQSGVEGIDYIPANISLSAADIFLSTAFCRESILKKSLKTPFFEKYDFILIDCLPSLGILLTNALVVSDYVLVPVQAQKFAVDGLGALYNIINMVKENLNPCLQLLGILPTMVDKTNMAKSVVELLSSGAKDEMLKTFISRSVSAAESSNAQKSLISLGGKLGAEYELVTEELLERMG